MRLTAPTIAKENAVKKLKVEIRRKAQKKEEKKAATRDDKKQYDLAKKDLIKIDDIRKGKIKVAKLSDGTVVKPHIKDGEHRSRQSGRQK